MKTALNFAHRFHSYDFKFHAMVTENIIITCLSILECSGKDHGYLHRIIVESGRWRPAVIQFSTLYKYCRKIQFCRETQLAF